MIPFLIGLRKALKQIVAMVEAQIDKLQNEEDDENQMELEMPDIPDITLPSRNEKALRIAAMEIGTKEVQGSGNNAKVVEYHKYASKNNRVEQPDSVPWCSSFICYVVEKAGMGSTNSMMARSWLKWGISVRKDPMPGDIVVYWRGQKSGWKGHVGIYLRTNRDGSIVTLGGNQSDEVNITAYNSSKLLDIRRSSKARPYTAQDREKLDEFAELIIQGKKIELDGKVT